MTREPLQWQETEDDRASAEEAQAMTKEQQLRDDFWRERERVDLLRAEIEQLQATLKAIERRTAPSTRTWDTCLRDMGLANDLARTMTQEQQLRDDFWKERERVDLRAGIERLTEAHERIVEWSRAYPLTVFPKPDLNKARELLEAGGMTLDAISADAMRHVIEGVAGISRAALERKP